MVIVYVWSASDGYGHASMLVDGGRPQGRIYISYWPASQGRDLNSFPPGGSGMTNYNAPAIRNRTFEDDMIGEQDRASDPPRAPTFRRDLGRLDETAIKAWWATRQRTWPRWDAAGNNCSTTVAEALKAGGADRFCGPLTFWSVHNFIWTPQNVIDYVTVIRRGQDSDLLESRTGVSGVIDRLTRGF